MKPQRDIDSLLKLLLSYEFKEQLSLLPTTIAPDEFSNHHYYQQVFQVFKKYKFVLFICLAFNHK